MVERRKTPKGRSAYGDKRALGSSSQPCPRVGLRLVNSLTLELLVCPACNRDYTAPTDIPRNKRHDHYFVVGAAPLARCACGASLDHQINPLLFRTDVLLCNRETEQSAAQP